MNNSLSFETEDGRAQESLKGHFNPENEAFEIITNSYYVDKTGLIGVINRTIGTTDNLICISRPRRFGKSYAAQMLCAYYDYTCDSRMLFGNLAISREHDYEKHINKYNVIYLDITSFISSVKSQNKDLSFVTANIVDTIIREMKKSYPEIADITSLSECFMRVKDITGRKFVFIIDEWDAIVREASDRKDVQDADQAFI